ncbi:hypothetical protein [Pyrobaculum islandicum]|nr:hypothetical protein [Pyrobaculum islandicum]
MSQLETAIYATPAVLATAAVALSGAVVKAARRWETCIGHVVDLRSQSRR